MSEEAEKIAHDFAFQMAEHYCGIPWETLRGLRDGSKVAVPREPTDAMLSGIRDALKRGMLAEGIFAAVVLAAAQEPPR